MKLSYTFWTVRLSLLKKSASLSSLRIVEGNSGVFFVRSTLERKSLTAALLFITSFFQPFSFLEAGEYFYYLDVSTIHITTVKRRGSIADTHQVSRKDMYCESNCWLKRSETWHEGAFFGIKTSNKRQINVKQTSNIHNEHHHRWRWDGCRLFIAFHAFHCFPCCCLFLFVPLKR